MNAAARSILELRRATLRLDDRLVFRRTDWTLRRGEHWLVVGPTGSGKTVFCRALCGELPLAAGSIDYRFPPAPGREAASSIERLSLEQWTADSSGSAPARWFSLDQEQSPRVADLLSRNAVEEINPFEIVARSPQDVARWERRARQIVRLLGIAPLLSKPLLALSNGEHRKIALAHALMRGPRILILDDPFAGLDASFRWQLRELLGSLIRRRVTTLILVGAQPADWPHGLTHLMRIDRFRIAAQGPLPVLRRDPRVARLLRESGPVPAAFRAASHPRPRPAVPGAELVRFRNVQAKWGDALILDRVDWTVRQGESWAIVGPNGSGKSTLLSFIFGENPQVYANDVRLFGRPRGTGESVWDIKRRIGWVSPEFHLSCDPTLAGLDTVLTGFYDGTALCEIPTPRQRAAARQWLRKLRIAPLADRRFGQMSTGEQRMLLLARALVKVPRLLILDEPCQGLDRRHRMDFVAEVDRQIRRGATVLYVTHRRDEIPPSIRRILHLKDGRARPGTFLGFDQTK
jgi:molybdate transport system ATP-binding protein